MPDTVNTGEREAIINAGCRCCSSDTHLAPLTALNSAPLCNCKTLKVMKLSQWSLPGMNGILRDGVVRTSGLRFGQSQLRNIPIVQWKVTEKSVKTVVPLHWYLSAGIHC